MSKLVLKKAADIEIFLDPFRAKIMRVMRDRHVPMTVKEIADAIGEVPAKVYYHVKKLEAIGVLSIKYTREINGIIAKYYDFTADSIALSVPDEDDRCDLGARVMAAYGRYFDEAKQSFFNLYNAKGTGMKDNDVYLYVKDEIPVDPDQMGKMVDEIKAVVERYRCAGKNARKYTVFLSAVCKPEQGAK